MTELVPGEQTERFAVKVNINSMFICDTEFGQRFKACMLEAIDRYNHITFLASKLITLHVIRLKQELNHVLPLSNPWASINWIANIKVDVCYHLSQRLERWIVLRFGADVVQQVPEKSFSRIASRIAETLTWKEKAAFARAQLLDLPDPTPPNYVAPATIDDLLGERVINNLEEPLSEESRQILWHFFTQEILGSIGSALPLCPSEFQEHAETSAWQVYYPFHLKMLIDIEQLAAGPLRPAEPANRPSRDGKLEQKAQRTIEKIRSGSFCPKQFLSSSGTNRAFSILPQFSFATRYLPVDNRVLRELLSTLWRRGYHPFPHQLPESARQGVPMTAARQELDNNHAEWWCRLFRLHRIQGIQVPGIPLPAGLPSRETHRRFDFYMSTDGVGSSFICRRPKRIRTPQTAVNPTTVPFQIGSSSFISIDPGLTDLVVGVRAELTRPRLPDGRVDVEARQTMPIFGNDRTLIFQFCARRLVFSRPR
ncbi:hypothetical protein V1505DRAFT_358684, partial [Lipomyces doorenjongii]